MNLSKNKNIDLEIENAPKIQGLKFRLFEGEKDYPKMIAVKNSAKIVDQIQNTYDLEELKNSYTHLSRCNPFTDMLFAEINGEVVAYGRVDWDEELNSDLLYNINLFVNPKWRVDQLGIAMIDHLINRAKEIAIEHPKENPKYIQIWVRERETWFLELIKSKEFKAVRYTYLMKRPCNLPTEVLPLPEGIEVRQIGEDDLRKVWDADQSAFADHWGFVPGTEKDYQGWLKWPLRDPNLWKVAWDGDQIVGMVLNFVDLKENEEFGRLRGYTEEISVQRPWRRQGIARALLTQSIKMFQEMGMVETVLNVDTENPTGALKLYQAVGYQEDKRSIVFRKKFQI